MKNVKIFGKTLPLWLVALAITAVPVIAAVTVSFSYPLTAYARGNAAVQLYSTSDCLATAINSVDFGDVNQIKTKTVYMKSLDGDLKIDSITVSGLPQGSQYNVAYNLGEDNILNVSECAPLTITIAVPQGAGSINAQLNFQVSTP